MRILNLFVSLFFLMATQNPINAQQQLVVSDIQNSGCISNARGATSAETWNYKTIVLKKVNDVLQVDIYRYYSNCATKSFDIRAILDEGVEAAPCSLTVDVTPVIPEKADCTCEFNVSYKLQGVEDNRFYFTCLWYEGVVELTDEEPLVLENITEKATIEGLHYSLNKTIRQAILDRNDSKGELRIPTEVEYDGQVYPVTAIRYDAFMSSTNLTKVFIPKTIKNLEAGNENSQENHYNPFNGSTALESIEVDDDNPVFCSVDGVLMNKEKTTLVKYPEGANRTAYTVPESVSELQDFSFARSKFKSLTMSPNLRRIGKAAFMGVKNIQTLDIPESVSVIDFSAFYESKFDSLIIRGALESEYMTEGLFYELDTKTKIYVKPSEVEKFQTLYNGTVYPLLSSGQVTGISDVESLYSVPAALFDLQGRRIVGTPKRGIYVKDGRKYVVK